MKEFIKKNKQNSQMDEHDKRTYRGAFAMLSILAAIIIISSLSVVYSNQIKKQFFQERSKNLLNISSKVGDMMNSMITDVWSCLDTMEYQVKKKKEMPFASWR